MSCNVTYTWYRSGRQFATKLVGKAAPPEVYSRILHVALDHEPRVTKQIKTLNVYHYGEEFLVELDILLDRDMPLHVAHDVSELIQRKIECLPYVERAYVRSVVHKGY